MYYVQGMTQQEIGSELRFSRTKITRLLARARDEGIVEIRISGRYRSCFEAERSMKTAFGLRDAVVVPGGVDAAETQTGVARACAEYLVSVLADGEVLGSGWGQHLFAMAQALPPQRLGRLRVVQLLGGLNSGRFNPQAVLEMIVGRLGATGVWLNTPAIVGSPEIKEALLRDEGVRRTLALGRTADRVIMGIGDITDEASLILSGAMTRAEMAELRDLGAVGDLMGWHFDIQGHPVIHDVTHRVLSIPLDDVRRIPLRIAGATGERKIRPILGALRGGYVNCLATDEATALAVLELADRGERAV